VVLVVLALELLAYVPGRLKVSGEWGADVEAEAWEKGEREGRGGAGPAGAKGLFDL
jgi:hypothetical protein